MESQNSKGLRLLLAGVLLLAPSLTGAQKQEDAASTGKERAAATGPRQPNRGMGEGIKVHGHWTIEVRNPDGTLVTRREFENALVAEGGTALARLLAIQTTPNFWIVWIGDSTFANNLCERAPGIRVSCGITTTRGALGTSPSEFFTTLSVNVPASGPNTNRLVFSGNATATTTLPGVLNEVLTQLRICPSTALPGTGCISGETQANVTRAQVSPAISIAPGQIIQVTVVISFS